MVVQFAGPDTNSVPQTIQSALFGGGAIQAFILGIAALFVYNQLKHSAKARRVSKFKSKVKRYQSRLRSAEGRLTRRGSRPRF